MEYKVQYQGKEILNWSPLGLTLNIAQGKTIIGKIGRSAVNETFTWPFGENSTIQNNYRQLTMQCKQDNGFVFDLVARVFNNNIAFRYELPLQKEKAAFQIVRENTGFNFTVPYIVYRHASESVISPTPINKLKPIPIFLLYWHLPGLFISINEAANDQYTKAVVGKTDKENSLVVKV
jgi:hypothetical protein